jgi:hypothetical protein
MSFIKHDRVSDMSYIIGLGVVAFGVLAAYATVERMRRKAAVAEAERLKASYAILSEVAKVNDALASKQTTLEEVQREEEVELVNSPSSHRAAFDNDWL